MALGRPRLAATARPSRRLLPARPRAPHGLGPVPPTRDHPAVQQDHGRSTAVEPAVSAVSPGYRPGRRAPRRPWTPCPGAGESAAADAQAPVSRVPWSRRSPPYPPDTAEDLSACLPACTRKQARTGRRRAPRRLPAAVRRGTTARRGGRRRGGLRPLPVRPRALQGPWTGRGSRPSGGQEQSRGRGTDRSRDGRAPNTLSPGGRLH
jgi:hypothetical protein